MNVDDSAAIKFQHGFGNAPHPRARKFQRSQDRFLPTSFPIKRANFRSLVIIKQRYIHRAGNMPLRELDWRADVDDDLRLDIRRVQKLGDRMVSRQWNEVL